MKTGTGEGARKLKLQRRSLLLRPTVTLSRIALLGIVATLQRLYCFDFFYSPPVVHRRMTDAERRAQKQPKSTNVMQKRGFSGSRALPILIRLDARTQTKVCPFSACSSLKWLLAFLRANELFSRPISKDLGPT